MREHNRIAEVLNLINPHWNDEIIYQNTRKIFTAAYQQIVYNEFLPRILGWDAVDKYDLRLSSAGYYKSNLFHIQNLFLKQSNIYIFKVIHLIVTRDLLLNLL